MGFIKLLLLSTLSFSRTELVELTAKQNIQTLKYFYKKDDSNFYMRGKDSLAFSSNFKSYPVITEETASQYGVTTWNNQDFLIWKSLDSHRVLSPNKDKKIFLYNVKSKTLENIGEGVSPYFFRRGKFISYYSMRNREIVVITTNNRAKTFRIKVNAKDPYFIPSFSISTLDTLYYTDINDRKRSGILSFDLEKKKRSTLYKTTSLGINLELCGTNDNLYILESSSGKKSFTNLYRLNYIETDISKRDFLFESAKGPAHSLHCQNDKERIFFIKNLTGLSGKTSEVLSYHLKVKKAFIHSDLKFVTNLLSIEGKLYIPFRKKIYVLDDLKGKFKINKELKEDD